MPSNGKDELLPRDEQAQRDADIVAARLRGLGWAQIARTYGLTVRRVQQIFAAWRQENKTLRHQDPLDIVDELLEQYQGAAEELALVAVNADNTSARVGAIRARMEAMKNIAELLQAVGVLPKDLGTLRVEMDVRYVAETILRVFDEEDVPERVQQRILQVLEGPAAN